MRIGDFARRQRDDEVDTDQRPFGEKWMKGAHPTVVDLGEIVPDRLAHVAVVTLARNVDQDRDVAIEAVATRQYAHARPLVELQHRQREIIERVLVELEQLVARVVLQHVDQRLAGMPVRIEAGAGQHRVDLAAQVGDGPRRARIGGGGEKADDAELAHELAGAIETFHAHIVHVDAPMHARAHRRLGDDEQRRLFQQRAHLRRENERLIPALDHVHLARAQDAQPALEYRFEHFLAGGEVVVADTQEGEIVVDQPFQERDGLGNLGRRQWRRIGLELGDLGGHARHHRPPVLDADADVGQHPFDGLDDLGASRLLLDALGMNVDDALAQRAGNAGFRALEGREPSGLVALDNKDRVHYEADIDAALGERRQHRIDQERHVVVDDLEHGIAALAFMTGDGARRVEPDFCLARFAHGEQGPGIGGQLGELARVVTHEIFGHRVSEQPGDEILRDTALLAAQDFAGRGDQRRFGALLVGAGKIGSCHGVSLGAPRAMKSFGLKGSGNLVSRPQLPRPQVFPIAPAASRAKCDCIVEAIPLRNQRR